MKKAFAVFSIVLIFFLFTLPLFATDYVFQVDVTLITDSSGGYTHYFATRRIYDNADATVTQYFNNPISIVYAGDSHLTGLQVKAVLDGIGSQLYTGYLVTLDIGGTNVIGNYTDLTPISPGIYYIPSDTYFTFTTSIQLTYSNPIVFTPYNFDTEAEPSYFGYRSGYEDGARDKEKELLDIITGLRNENDLLRDQNTTLVDAYNQGVQYGLDQAAENQKFVQNVVTTSITSFSDVVKIFLDLKILGISVYQVVLLACLIPLFVIVFKFVVHKNG